MSSTGIEEALQNEHRGYLIDDRTAISRLAAGGVQVAMRLGGREPFVPERELVAPVSSCRSWATACALSAWGLTSPDMYSGLPTTTWAAAILAHQPGQGAKVLARGSCAPG